MPAATSTSTSASAAASVKSLRMKGEDKDAQEDAHLPQLPRLEIGRDVAGKATSAEKDCADVDVETTLRQRWAILALMILAMFVDVLSSSAFFVFTGIIASQLDVAFTEQSWIINSYTVTFASSLLLFGRVSDIFSARPVFAYGFLAFGVLSLVNSFLVDRYSFFVVRALTGVAAATLVPSAYRLIASIFPPAERARAYTLYGMTGSIANVSGTIVAGVIELIQAEGQLTSWRWFFRILAVLSFAAGSIALWIIPLSPRKERYADEATSPAESISRWRRLDMIGVVMMFLAILLLIVGLTLGATYGFSTPGFIVPLILSALLFPAFFYWESRLPLGLAIVPPDLWRLPNFTVLILFALVILGWWAVVFVPLIELFHLVGGESVILAAVRTLPIGLSAGVLSVLLVVFPKIIAKPRWPIVIGLLGSITGYALWVQVANPTGSDYWRYILPGMVIGSAGTQTVLLATMVAVMLVAPPEQAGVVGAVLQTSMHTSTVIALSIQAGLMTVRPGGVHDILNVRASWYFELGWLVVWLIGFIALYRPGKNVNPSAGGGVAAL